MIRGFTFERALSWTFSAPHAATFPFIYGLAYALAFMGVFALIGALGFNDFKAWFTLVQGMENETDQAVIAGAMWDGVSRLLPWTVITILLSWALWAMFETASQRRYIWGEGFSLRFGADELRMMAVGLLWWLLAIALIFLPMLLIFGATFWTMFSNLDNPEVSENDAFATQVGMQVFGTFALMLVILPLYIFLATRLAPCFGLTVMSRRIRFLDAWSVSRGRFWPIFGAYAILAIGGSIVGQVVTGIAQGLMMPVFIRIANMAETGGDPVALLMSAELLVPMGIFYFLVLFVQGVLQHIVGGPAAFAARHDPAGGVEDAARVDAFV
ncbi:hypothetical protein [Hyphomonas sp.]|uniref:hypothetical protein n=1 Tax=Hyphomonas sp. TaxID=87 RepID=UPI00391AEFE2